ncbi:bone marrow stromal antigen 2 [Camelus ferus]|uniref:Bone marrow stromal antigen 2 n=1 Tax=Camelus ferus TaxID=419612 RepID=A0A8B8RTC6_CAMFR|nr:bone marrow stromal antigen 2 [Camelus ferus]
MKRKPKPKAWAVLCLQISCSTPPSQRTLPELIIGQHSSYAYKGAAPVHRRFQRPSLTPIQTPYWQIWLAPTFYHYSPMPMLDCYRKLMQRGRKLPGWLWFLLFLMVLVVVALLVPLIIFTIRANSKSCKDGLQAEQKCQNSTNLLQRQLTQTEEVLQETKAQATICIQSVETLRDSLEKEKALGREQLARAEELQDEVLTLKQKLNTLEEAERQRKRSEASAANSSSSCWSILGFLITLNMLILCL